MMSEPIFDLERHDVYRLSIDAETYHVGQSTSKQIVSDVHSADPADRARSGREGSIEYEYEYEYRDAEYEYEGTD